MGHLGFSSKIKFSYQKVSPLFCSAL